jgi:mono/diheme cytochrome c family protein
VIRQKKLFRRRIMKRILKTIAVLACCIIILLLNAELGVRKGLALDSPPKTAQLLDRGKQLYEKNCLPCHGIQGNGRGPMAGLLNPLPPNFTEPFQGWKNSKGDPMKIFEVVKKGVPNSPMIAFPFGDEDIWALVYTVMEFSEGAP